MKIFKFVAEKEDENLRVDKFLSEKTSLSRRSVRKIIEAGGCFINGKRCHIVSYTLKAGDRIKVAYIEDLNYRKYEVSKDEIVYEDEYFIVLNKVSGVPVNLSVTGAEGSIQKGVEIYFKKIGINHKPSVIHRLDMGTSGLLIFGKSKEVERIFYELFRKKEIKKEYVAVLSGKLEEKKGRIKTKIARDIKFLNKYKVAYNRGKEAITYFKVLKEGKKLSLVRLTPKSGRPHQLRVHMAFYKTPILGDVLYGGNPSNRLYLHGFKLEFIHPITKMEIALSALPQNNWNFFYEELKKIK